MAVRNRWLLPTGVFFMLAVLVILVLGNTSPSLGLPLQSNTTAVLHVPADYATIQAAIDAARPNDIIQVAPGTYVENIRLDKPIALTAATFNSADAAGNTTAIDGGDGEVAILIPASLPRPPSVHGFVIRNGHYGIEARSPVTLENNYFYGSRVAVHYLPGSGGTNRGNVYFASSDDALRVDEMSQPLLVENNRFLYSGDDSIELGLPGTAMTAPLEVDILNNVLAGSAQDGIKFIDYASNPRDFERRIIVAGNLIVNNQRAGIGIVSSGSTSETYSGVNATESVWAYNNTFYGNDYGISGGENLVAFNNVISNSLSRGAWRVQPTTGTSSVIAYTLFWNNRVDADQTLLGPGNLFGRDPLVAFPPGPGPDGSMGTVDDDFSGLLLSPGSPAIDHGTAQFLAAGREAIPPGPLSGFAGLAPDLGWREFGGSPIAALVPVSTPAARRGVEPLPASSPTAAGEPASIVTPGRSPSPQATSTESAGVSAQPTLIIDSIAPVRVKPMGYVTITVKGSGFQQATVVSFEGIEDEAPQVVSSLVVDSNTIQAQVRDIDDDNDTDVWDLRVTNPDGASLLLPRAFTVAP